MAKEVFIQIKKTKSIFFIVYNHLKKIHLLNYQITLFDKTIKNRLILFVILLMILGQLSVALYLPSFPAMVNYFHTHNNNIQYSLTLYLIGYGISQFIYGPLSDIFGRRLIILGGLLIFILASFFCLMTTSIYSFLIARFAQGVGLGCGDTMGRAILCDRFEGNEFVRAASYIGMAATVTPLIGPIIGGYIDVHLSWQVNFILILLCGIIGWLIIFYYFPETKSSHQQIEFKLKSIINGYLYVIKNRIFLAFFVPGLVCFVGELLYSIQSPFILMQQLQWSPVGFGWLSIFAITGLLTGTFFSHRFSFKYSHQRMVTVGMSIILSSSLMMLILNLIFSSNTFTLLAPMYFFMLAVGLIYPNTNMGALTPFSNCAGIAGALQGGLQMLLGGLVGSMFGFIPANQLNLSISLTLLCAIGFFLFLYLINIVFTLKSVNK